MKLGRRAVVAGGLAIATGAIGGTGSMLLDAVDVHPADYPTVVAVRWLGEQLERETGGRVRIRQFPSGQLGSEDDALGFARYHAIALARVAVPALNNAVPETRLLSVPYGFRDIAHMRRVVDGAIGDELLAPFGPRGLVGLAYYDAAPRNFYNIRGPLETPADLQGLKIRTPLSDLFLDMVRALGANPTPLSFGNTFQALETHLVDGAENNLPSYESSRHFETARYLSETGHSLVPDVLLMSKSVFEKLAPHDQELVRDLARQSVQVMREHWDKRTAAARHILTAAGVAFNRPDPAPFISATAGVRRKHLSEPGLRKLFQRIQAS